MEAMKPRKPVLQSVRLLDQVKERIRYLHYSLNTEKIYLYWVKFIIRWHGLRRIVVLSPFKTLKAHNPQPPQ